jgi:riboflavin synthase
VVEIAGNLYKFNLSQETLRLANFGDLTRGSYVNIELPLTMQDFLGGHLVSGHLEGVVRVKAINAGPGGAKFSFVYRDRQWKKFLIYKGSVTLNGVSLTISEVKSSYFSVEIIPHTLESTNLKYLKIGERVNLELDMLAKYLYNLIHP